MGLSGCHIGQQLIDVVLHSDAFLMSECNGDKIKGFLGKVNPLSIKGVAGVLLQSKNGLQKFEPNDINKSMMVDLERLDEGTESKILGYYHLYRQSVLEKKVDDGLIELINEVFVGCFT
jgi:hypothetical protein